MLARRLTLSVVLSAVLAGSALARDMATLEVMNGAEPAVSQLNLAPCQTPSARRNILKTGEVIETGSRRRFAVAPGGWIVSLQDGAVSAQFEFVAGRTEHYTLMES